MVQKRCSGGGWRVPKEVPREVEALHLRVAL